MSDLNIKVLITFILLFVEVNSVDDSLTIPLSESDQSESTILSEIDNVPIQTVLSLPKCCKTGEVYDLRKQICIIYEQNVTYEQKFDILDHNETHLNNESLDISKFLYKFNDSPLLETCKTKYILNNTSNARFLRNGSLVPNFQPMLISPLDFCTELMHNAENEKTDFVVVLCAPRTNSYMYFFYMGFLVISIISLLIGAFLFYFKFEATENVHRLCILLYFLFIDLNCIVQLIILVLGNGNCKVLGIFFQITYIWSNTWLLILCFDVLYIIRNCHENTKWDKRIIYYSVISLFPWIFSLFSLLTEGGTAVPNTFFKYEYNMENMCFVKGNTRKAFFYCPVVFCIFGCMGILAYTYYTYYYHKKPPTIDSKSWVTKKAMFKQCLIGFIFAFCLFVVHCWSQFLMNPSNGIGILLEICDGLHGFFLFGIFFGYKHNLILLDLWKRKSHVQEPAAQELNSLNDINANIGDH